MSAVYACQGEDLGYAGLELEPPSELPDSWFGAIAEDADRKLTIIQITSVLT